jgi:hypothetical protein
MFYFLRIICVFLRAQTSKPPNTEIYPIRNCLRDRLVLLMGWGSFNQSKNTSKSGVGRSGELTIPKGKHNMYILHTFFWKFGKELSKHKIS